MSNATTAGTELVGSGWDAFWFRPATVGRVATVRGGLCLLTVLHYLASWSDSAYWYGQGGPLSASRVATFLRTGGLEDVARWIVSPLFLSETSWVYHAYLIVGILLCLAAAAGRGGRVVLWMTWLVFVGWANRAMILSGWSETLLSLGLFAAAIAPPAAAWQSRGSATAATWTARFSARLMAAQITLVGVATFVTMLAGRVWYNGLGAYALAAPVQDRWIDWTQSGSLLVRPAVHELLTHALVAGLPIGLACAWTTRWHRAGLVIVCVWCAIVAMLGSHWLYAATFAVTTCAITPWSDPTVTGTGRTIDSGTIETGAGETGTTGSRR